ncbi:MAG: hypothetical protein AAFV33_29750, partial [Chloroflexota bacterium]
TDLVIVATNVQKLNRLVETSIIFDVKYDPNLTVGDRAEMVRHNNNTFGIGIGRPTLRLSQQEQIRTAGHQLWHIELARIGESTNAAFGTPEYALEEVNVERRNLKGLVHQQSEFDGLGVECWYGQTQRQPHGKRTAEVGGNCHQRPQQSIVHSAGTHPAEERRRSNRRRDCGLAVHQRIKRTA